MDTGFGKQPYEELTIDADFSRTMVVGSETIISQTVTAEDRNGDDVTGSIVEAGTVTNDGATKVLAFIKGGSRSGSPYKITFRCVTSAGHKWELDVLMEIIDG